MEGYKLAEQTQIIGGVQITGITPGNEDEKKPVKFKIGQETYSWFDYKKAPGFNVGDTVQITYVENGKYKNIKEMIKLGSDVRASTSSTQMVQQVKYFTDSVPANIEAAINSFCKEHQVFAMQTHVFVFEGAIRYAATVFYRS